VILTSALTSSTRRRKPPTRFARANERTRTVAVINGGTWVWKTERVVGSLRAGGRTISRRKPERPAVGFTRKGGLIFGARRAFRARANNIIPGVAYLFARARNGRTRPIKSQREAPYANDGQFWCGARTTPDQNGCFRSNIIEFESGRVGFVEWPTQACCSRRAC
jgi:hypothetical protein